MTNALHDATEQFVNEALGIFPPNRVLVLLLGIAGFVALIDTDQGIWWGLAATSPLQVLGYPSGSLWGHAWLAWILIVSTYFSAIGFADQVRKLAAKFFYTSKHRKAYQGRIDSVAADLASTSAETMPALLDGLKARYEIGRKRVLPLTRSAETILAAAGTWLIYSSAWTVTDGMVFCFLFVTGLATQYLAYRVYVSSVAPAWLLYGLLSGSFVDLEEGM